MSYIPVDLAFVTVAGMFTFSYRKHALLWFLYAKVAIFSVIWNQGMDKNC